MLKRRDFLYITKQGECWDEVARAVYGSEKHIGFLMQNNPEMLDITVFSAGIKVNTPEMTAKEEDMPIWRRRA